MHLISGLLAIVLPSFWPPTNAILPSIMPTAAPPSGNPANALISASKDATGALSGLAAALISHLAMRNPA
jgi:hypothetical protein